MSRSQWCHFTPKGAARDIYGNNAHSGVRRKKLRQSDLSVARAPSTTDNERLCRWCCPLKARLFPESRDVFTRNHRTTGTNNAARRRTLATRTRRFLATSGVMAVIRRPPLPERPSQVSLQE